MSTNIKQVATRRTQLTLQELDLVQGGSGSNTVFVQGTGGGTSTPPARNGETGILVEGGMTGGTGI